MKINADTISHTPCANGMNVFDTIDFHARGADEILDMLGSAAVGQFD
jgi:hypothetical protein